MAVSPLNDLPPAVREVLDGDQAVALAYATPAKGVVIAPVTNFGMWDADRGTISVNTSVGTWKKLDRIRRDPNVALAFHTREHGASRRPVYVLAQGRAELSPPIPDYPSTVGEHWERYERWQELNPLWKRWLRVFALRVEIAVRVERLLVWPDLHCRGKLHVLGAAQSLAPPPQQLPAKGTGPRVPPDRAAKRAKRLPHLVLGWTGADGFPMVIPAATAGAEPRGVLLDVPPDLVPAGGRRAGLTAHWFAPRVVGQHQRLHTGWLEHGEDGRVVYAPHTLAAYRFPASDPLFRLVAGGATRWGVRQARKAGVLPPDRGRRV
jgi:Pyridoxamine 5'-phosphate oxidase